jgi:hypothetical protein
LKLNKVWKWCFSVNVCLLSVLFWRKQWCWNAWLRLQSSGIDGQWTEIAFMWSERRRLSSELQSLLRSSNGDTEKLIAAGSHSTSQLKHPCLYTALKSILSIKSDNTYPCDLVFFFIVIFPAWFQASAAMHKRSALFCDTTQRTVEIPYRRFGTIYLSHIQGSRSPRRKSGNFVPTFRDNLSVLSSRVKISKFLLGLLDPWRWDR